MADRDTLVQLSNLAWDVMRESIDGLTEHLAWASVELQPDEYLHSEGSILSQIAHVASGKFIYGSVGFQESELRWRDLATKIDSIWPNLDASIAWLNEAHAYWMNSWSMVENLEVERSKFDGSLLPGWKLIATVIHHDHYHAGQIHLQKSILAPSSTPPPSEGSLWQKYCEKFSCW